MAGTSTLRRGPKPKERSTVSLALGDASVLGLWVLISSVFEELSAMLAAALGIPPLAAGLAVLCAGLALYAPICTAVGGEGACFNPSQNFAFAAAGRGSFATHLVRSAAQTAGGALGASAALRVIPSAWQGKFSNYAHGVTPGMLADWPFACFIGSCQPLAAHSQALAGTSLLGGVIAEAILSFFLNLAILWSLDTRYKFAANFAPYIATIILIPIGSGYSGPFMNPAFAFSWFYHLKGAELWEHVAVFWIGCLAGSYAAGLVWWFLTSPSKKARGSRARLAASKQASKQPAAGGSEKKTK